MEHWEFKASLANITNSRTVRFMFQKQYKRQESEQCRESQQWQSRKLYLFQNASSSWQSGPRRLRKRQPRTQLPNLLGVDIKLPLPSTPSLEFLIPPRSKTRGVLLSLRSLASAPRHSAVRKSRMELWVCYHTWKPSPTQPLSTARKLQETAKGQSSGPVQLTAYHKA